MPGILSYHAKFDIAAIDRDVTEHYDREKAPTHTVTLNICLILETREIQVNQKKRWWNTYRDDLIRMNLFSNKFSHPSDVRRQRIITRLYLVSLFLFFLVIIMYTILPTDSTIKTVTSPSLPMYEELQVKYSSNPFCPCKQIAVPYKEFLTVDIDYHHICASEFVKRPWIKGLFSHSYWFVYRRADIRVRGAAYFNLLAVLCEKVQANIKKSVDDFLQETFRSYQAVPDLEFHSQMNATNEAFKVSTRRQFGNALELYRNMSHGNSFVSSYFLNWFIWLPTSRLHVSLPISPVVIGSQCSCGTRSDCVDQGGVFNTNTGELRYPVPGLSVGCSVVETLLRSNLKCLYMQECIDAIRYYSQMSNVTIQALNASSLSSRFPVDSTVEEMVEALFVEKWQFNVSYSEFYQQCAPVYCAYTLNERKQISFIISRLLGLYGGITVSLRFLAPCIVSFFFKIKNYRRPTRVTVFP